MTFAYPWVLWLLILPALLLTWEVFGRRTRIALPHDHGEQRSGRWWSRALLAAGVLPACLLAVAILLAAGPLKSATPRQVRELTNVEFVLDVSGSMTSEFGEKGSRYDAAMGAIDRFTTHRTGDAFGLTVFGNEVLRWTPLTQDTSAIRSATPLLRPESMPGQFGGTQIGKAVMFAKDGLAQRGEGDRLLILLSDGESADLGSVRAAEIAAQLARDGVALYAVHIGEGPPPNDLTALSSPTGGQVFAAADPRSLDAVFAHIDHMRPVRMKPAAAHKVFFYGPLAIAGLALLGMQTLASFGLRYTPW